MEKKAKKSVTVKLRVLCNESEARLVIKALRDLKCGPRQREALDDIASIFSRHLREALAEEDEG